MTGFRLSAPTATDAPAPCGPSHARKTVVVECSNPRAPVSKLVLTDSSVRDNADAGVLVGNAAAVTRLDTAVTAP